MIKNKIKILLLSFLLLEFILSYQPALAQQTSGFDYNNAGVSSQIENYLCAPNQPTATSNSYTNGAFVPLDTYQTNAAFNNTNNNILFKCINQIYKFAIVVAAVVGVFFIVIAGYLYMSSDGDQEAVTKAKDIIRTTIASIVILLGGYVLLKALNPDLVVFHSIQPPSVTSSSLPSISPPTGSGTGTSGGASYSNYNGSACPVNRGSCQVSVLSQCQNPNWDANFASAICGIESAGGNPSIESGVDHCVDDKSFSFGLMQINIIASGGAAYMPAACPANIFVSSDGQKIQSHIVSTDANHVNHWNCRVANMDQYTACKNALSDPATNITAACSIFGQIGWARGWPVSFPKCTAGVTQPSSSSGSGSGGAISNSNTSYPNKCGGGSNTGGVLLIGDSMLVGMQPTLAGLTQINGNSNCVQGSTIGNFSVNSSSLNSAQPTMAIVVLGTNNWGDSASSITNQTNQLLSSLNAAGVGKIILVGAPRFTQPQVGYTISPQQNLNIENGLQAAASGKSGVCYYDTYAGPSLYTSAQSDIHPGAAGFKTWANAVWSFAQSCN